MPKTKEEIAAAREAALKHLEEHKEELDKFNTKIGDQEDRWQREIALLERRVESNIKDIQIGDEDETIAIRASLSDYEAGEIAKLDKERVKLNLEKDLDRINELTYQILATITANPLMTAKWFSENRKVYSTEDMLSVILSYFELMSDRAKRVAEIQQFRV